MSDAAFQKFADSLAGLVEVGLEKYPAETRVVIAQHIEAGARIEIRASLPDAGIVATLIGQDQNIELFRVEALPGYPAEYLN